MKNKIACALIVATHLCQSTFAHIKDLRKDFPILNQATEDGHPLVFFDNAATTQKPRYVIDTLSDFYTHYNANVHRKITKMGFKATELYEHARDVVTAFINAADRCEVIFTRGTTDSINAAAYMIGSTLQPGDEIVITELEHHANIMPWQRLAHEKQAVLKVIPVSQCDGTLLMDTVTTIITPKTKVVAVSLASNSVGTHNDVRPIIDAAHQVGALVLLDAAQAIAHEPVDVQKLGADFLAFSGHKMMGPTGIGVLYINKKHHDLPPYQVGGGMVNEINFVTASFHESPLKFEAGTPPIAQAIGLAAACDYFRENISYKKLHEYEAHLSCYLIEQLQQLPHIRILGPIEYLKNNGHIVSFVVKDTPSHEVSHYLADHGVFVRASRHCAQPLAAKMQFADSVRVSFYVYNTIEEIDRLIEVLGEFLENQGR